MNPLLVIIGQFLINPYFAYTFFVCVLVSPYYLKKYQDRASLQSTAVSLGILGTFLGIFGGMLQFDVRDIEASIPTLLGGLQLAFLTPIAGIFTALMIRVRPKTYGISETEENNSEQDELILIRQELKGIAKSLSGDEETTLLTQIQKLRTSMADKQDELNKSFKEFAAKMAEDNKASLIEALKEVIKDFNAKINEQFGENFKHLNEGVGKMLEWQENYTRQVEKAVAALQVAEKSLETSAEVMSMTSKNAEDFKEVAEELKKQLEAMGAAMTGMKSLAESLKNSGKEIRDEMEEITKQSIAALGNNLASISEKMVEDYSQLQRVISSIAKNG